MPVRPAVALAVALATLAAAGNAVAWTGAEGRAQLAAIEARWQTLSEAARRDAKALAELDRRASALAEETSRALAKMREDAAERDADMSAVVASEDWQTAEALLVKLRFRIAAIELERALAGDPDRKRLALAAAEGFSPFVEAPDAALAGESRYGRGLARIAGGDREGGMADLRDAARAPAVAPRAHLALAETLADAGDSRAALEIVSKQLAAGGLTRDLALRAKLLRLRLLVSSRSPAGKEAARSAPGPAGSADSSLVSDLLAAGDPWRSSALALLHGHEDLLPTGPGADATALRLRADAAARDGDAETALSLYREAAARAAKGEEAAALEGVARAALATGAWDEARSAVEGLRGKGRPLTRELALIDLRAAYGAWQASPDPARAGAALAAAAAAVPGSQGATADDRAEAAYRAAEAMRASGDLAGAIAAFAAIDAPAWRLAARGAALQTRVTRHVREPGREPRDALLRDLGAWIAADDVPDEARAVAIVLDATLRTEAGAERPRRRTSPRLPRGRSIPRSSEPRSRASANSRPPSEVREPPLGAALARAARARSSATRRTSAMLGGASGRRPSRRRVRRRGRPARGRRGLEASRRRGARPRAPGARRGARLRGARARRRAGG